MITLKQWAGVNVTPADDAALYAHFDARSGIISGCEVTHLGANQLHIAAGRGMICGRQFAVEAETVLVTLSSSGSVSGRLLVQLNLANAENPITFISQAASSLPDLVQEDLNAGGTIYQLVLATYTADSTLVSNVAAANNIIYPIYDADNFMRVSPESKQMLYSQTLSDGRMISTETLKSYPTRAGVYRVGSQVAGLPSGGSGYGVLIIWNGGTYAFHMYRDNAGVLYTSKNSTNDVEVMAPSSWTKHTGTSVSAQ